MFFAQALSEYVARASATQDGAKADPEKGWINVDKYKTPILDNIQIEIKNIHIRLEDQKENVLHSFNYDPDLQTLNDNTYR